MAERKIETPNKKELVFGAVWLWAGSQGIDEITNDNDYWFCSDITFKKNNKTYAFIIEVERSFEELKTLTKKAALNCDYIYVVTDDNAKRRELIKVIPSACGILCYGNSFGLGNIYQILKEARLCFGK